MLYYASKISNNMAMTPEGFLVCRNVPIARTGPQKYAAAELPIDFDISDLQTTDVVTVYRAEADVFDPSAIASFEAKPVTNDHPPIGVEIIIPDNATKYIKGTT
ncbi:MAG: DUF2213 domain-containing protein [Turicibacter sp.]|nr:DUF2213 domain-containing protein [Turicibacter sp.]